LNAKEIGAKLDDPEFLLRATGTGIVRV